MLVTPYLILTIGIYSKGICFLLIIKLGYYFINFSQLYIKKYKIIINRINNAIAFWLKHNIHIKVSTIIILAQAVLLKNNNDYLNHLRYYP